MYTEGGIGTWLRKSREVAALNGGLGSVAARRSWGRATRPPVAALPTCPAPSPRPLLPEGKRVSKPTDPGKQEGVLREVARPALALVETPVSSEPRHGAPPWPLPLSAGPRPGSVGGSWTCLKGPPALHPRGTPPPKPAAIW